MKALTTHHTNLDPINPAFQMAGSSIQIMEISQYSEDILRICQKFTPDPFQAEESSRLILNEAKTRISELRSQKHLTAWILALAYNICVETLLLKRNTMFQPSKS